MSNALRRTGSRDDRQRLPRESSQPAPYQSNRPFKVSVPPKNVPQTASILKTRAFRLLVDAVGAENIALALDLNLSRVTELGNGEAFTPETAFHMETTLGLPDGFFDHPNPTLASETITRLKTPLKVWEARMDAAREDVDRGVLTDQTVAPSSTDLIAEPQMPRTQTSGAAQDAASNASRSVAVTANQRTGSVAKAPQSVLNGPKKTEAKSSPLFNDLKALAEIRRINLLMLTVPQGAKAQLGRLLEISQSNMAHRLHGQKRMDDVEARRITEKLGLPAGWLDVPRQPADVPEAVAVLLSPPSRRGSAHPEPDQRHPGAQSNNRASSKKAEKGKCATTVVLDNLALPFGKITEVDAEPPSQQDSIGDQLMKPALRVRDWGAPSVGFNSPETDPLTPATSLETLRGIAPIAEALLKTLAGKARAGHLDEARALQLLQQIMLP